MPGFPISTFFVWWGSGFQILMLFVTSYYPTYMPTFYKWNTKYSAETFWHTFRYFTSGHAYYGWNRWQQYSWTVFPIHIRFGELFHFPLIIWKSSPSYKILRIRIFTNSNRKIYRRRWQTLISQISIIGRELNIYNWKKALKFHP